jgi:F0F1-type ATP synthase membrane subunit a
VKLITSLFSSFDPIGGIIFINYTTLLLRLSCPLSLLIFVLSSRSVKNYTKNLFYNLDREINATVPNKNKKGKINTLVSVFFVILILNIMGLTPYVFTLTAQIAITLSLALPF